jgi:hypothetical protein
MQFALEKVVTDGNGVSTVLPITDVRLSQCQNNPLGSDSPSSTTITAPGMLCSSKLNQRLFDEQDLSVYGTNGAFSANSSHF